MLRPPKPLNQRRGGGGFDKDEIRHKKKVIFNNNNSLKLWSLFRDYRLKKSSQIFVEAF